MSALLEEREEKAAETSLPVHKRPPRQYSPDEIGQALALVDYYGGNISRAANELGYPWSTVKYWLANAESLPSAAVSVRERKRSEFAQVSDDLADWIAGSITQADIDRAPLRDKVVSYGILRDKSAQDRGEATSIVEHRGESAQQALERLYDLARAKNPSVTRDEVREKLCAAKPELRPLLLNE
jgi:hypothetical protein